MSTSIARRRSFAFASWVLIASLSLASCDTLSSLSGSPGGAEKRPTPIAPKPSSSTIQRPAQPVEPPLSDRVDQEALPVVAPPAQDQPVKVALLLPLSGPLGKLGSAMSEAAQMAMFDLADRRFQLVPIDDKGTPGGAAEAAKQAVSQGAQIVLGPLLAASVRSAGAVAAESGLPVVAFSSDRNVASPGIYIIGFTPEGEVDRVVGYAAASGRTRFAALAPDNAYGAVVVEALRKAAAAHGGSVVKAELYDPKTQDFVPVVRRLMGIADPQTASALTGEAAPPPVTSFDAILLAEGGAQLRAMAAALSAAGVGPPSTQLLGTGKWDEPGIGTETSLIGAWFAGPVPSYRADFEARYKRTFGQAPPRLATLAYDATALATVLARGPEQKPFTAEALTDPNGFFGRDGLFRLTSTGLVERRLAILRVDRSGVIVIDEPARSFAAGS